MKSRFLDIFLRRVSSASFFANYNRILETHPLLTKCITSGAIGIVSDTVAQTCFAANAGFDMTRLLNL